MDNPETKKTTTQYVLDTTMRKQTRTMQTRQAPSHKQLEAKTNRTLFLCENCNGHHKTELRTSKL